MSTSRFAILGGGMVAGYAAKQFVEMGLKPGELAIVSADNFVPYERPPLSKTFLAGKDNEDAIQISPSDFYKSHGIELKLQSEVTAVDIKRKRLVFKSGGEFSFGKLIIATGARVRKLNVPGANLRNVFYLRSLDDSRAIRNEVKKVTRAVIVGGGFIGMEVAAVLSQAGLDVTMVLNDERVSKRLFTPEMSNFFESYYKERGVRLLKSAAVTELRGDGSVKSAVLADGQTIPCELVVAGIGVQPETEMLASSGFKIENGVVVNEYLETGHADMWAAGDVANYSDILFQKRRRVEHWDNAVSQGQYCARALMGERTPFKHVPYFFSDVFDLSYEYWGDSSGADQIVHRGDFSKKSFSTWWLREQTVVAAFTMNRLDEEREVAPKWIESRHTASAKQLADTSRSLGTL
ncbi:MAG TPA: FAD-dependent oxidoreductase [Terriglobales bacterium]|nr:FAD-dependent oxidoreductase [Terriglobales bacterium]